MRSEAEIADKLKEVYANFHEGSEDQSDIDCWTAMWVCLRWVMGEDV